MRKRLCRFYLECVEAEDLRSLRLRFDQRGRQYACPWSREVPFFRGPAVESALQVIERSDAEFLRKGQAQIGPERLFYGYPVYVDSDAYLTPLFFVECTASRRNQETHAAQYSVRLTDAQEMRANHHLFGRRGLPIEELSAICDELEGDFGTFEERLRRAFELLGEDKPDWNGSQVERLPDEQSLEKNRWYGTPILFRSEYTIFTQQLRKELRDLVRYPTLLQKAPGTALSPLLGIVSTQTGAPPPSSRRIVPVLQLNSSQLQAVKSGLEEPLTVVTGPPGTGKSQVVVNLLASMALQGRPVLFASKNNRAVDVVRERLDLRQAEATIKDVTEAIESVRVQERACANAKMAEAETEASLPSEWGLEAEPCLPATFSLEVSQCRALASGRGVGVITFILTMIFPGLYRRACAERLVELTSSLPQAIAADVDSRLKHASEPPRWAELMGIVEDLERYQTWMNARRRAQEESGRLAARDSAAVLSLRMGEAQRRHSDIAGRYFRRVWAERVLAGSPALRVLTRRFFDLADRIRSTPGREAWHNIRREWEETARELFRDLPVWVVTNLSANRSLPLVAGLFDLVVIDEASQCDVASALPLLYRARRAVVIGDPHQLRHIGTLNRKDEEAAAERHDCTDLVSDWSYINRSVFDVAELALARGDQRAIFLSEHYRSHPEIIEFSNREFYERQLVLRSELPLLLAKAGELPVGVYWHNVEGQAPYSGHSAHNPSEVRAVLAVLRGWLEAGLASCSSSVGIVTPSDCRWNAPTRLYRPNDGGPT